MIRHALRTIGRMPGLAAVVILSLGVGIGVNTDGVLVDPGGPAEADSRRRRQRQLLSPRAEVRHRHVSGHVVGGVSRPETAAAIDRGAGRVPHGAAQRRRGRAHRADLRAAGLRKLLHARFACGRSPDGSSRRTKCERPGGEPVVVLSHDYWQTHFAGSPSAIGQTIRVNDSELTIIGVAPEGLPGHDPRAAIRSVGAGDAGAGAVRRIDASSSIAISAATRRWAACVTARTKRGATGEFVVGDARAGRIISREQRPHQRRADAVLEGAARPADDVHHRPRHPAGRDAAGPARGLRQHRQPRPRARQLALSRSRRAPRARRRARQRDPADADREPAARHLRRDRRHPDRVVGHRSAAIDAAVRRVPGPLSDQPRCARPRVRGRSSASAAACSSAPRRRCSWDASIRSRRSEAARSRRAAAPSATA